MAKRTIAEKARRDRAAADIHDLEKRIEALERRVAILEAKRPQPDLRKVVGELAPTERRTGLEQVQ